MANIIERIRAEIERRTRRSAWSKGVAQYALELLDHIEEGIHGGYYNTEDLFAPKMVERMALNGAGSWEEFSWGGCSLIYDGDIAERLCTPSELKKTLYGERKPNSREEWLDTQARALFQAHMLLQEAIKAVR